MLEIIKKRRSIRRFTQEPLSQEEKDKLLKAALLAPSSKSLKPLEFIVVESRGTMARLQTCKNFGTAALATAAMAIVVIGDTGKSDVWVEDASVASSFILLEAEALGLGANWIQMRLRQSDRAPSEKEVREVLSIPEKYGVLSIIAIGKKGEEKQAYDDSDADFSKIHREKF